MDSVDSPQEWWTPLGVRLRRARRAPGPWNWLLLPGLPGIDSDSLTELVHVLRAPGTSWLVDLPGSGSNSAAPDSPADPYRLWPDVLVEAVDALPNPIAIGHSIGGEYLLSVPQIEQRLSGLVLISSAPDSGWMPDFAAMSEAHPGFERASERYDTDPCDDNLRALAMAGARWYFTEDHLDIGRGVLGRVTHHHGAAGWSSQHFDRTYLSRWWPNTLPTLVISGREDRRIGQHLWHDPYYRAPNVVHVSIAGAAHFPWIERPDAVHDAVADFVERCAEID